MWLYHLYKMVFLPNEEVMLIKCDKKTNVFS